VVSALGTRRGVDLCKMWVGPNSQFAGEMKILNNWGQIKCRQLLIARKPLFVLNALHNSMNDI